MTKVKFKDLIKDDINCMQLYVVLFIDILVLYAL